MKILWNFNVVTVYPSFHAKLTVEKHFSLETQWKIFVVYSNILEPKRLWST